MLKAPEWQLSTKEKETTGLGRRTVTEQSCEADTPLDRRHQIQREQHVCRTLTCFLFLFVCFPRGIRKTSSFFPPFFSHVFTAASVLLLVGYISAQPHTDNMAEMILMFCVRNGAKIISQILATSRKCHWMLNVCCHRYAIKLMG